MKRTWALKALAVLISIIIAAVSVCACNHNRNESDPVKESDGPAASSVPSDTEMATDAAQTEPVSSDGPSQSGDPEATPSPTDPEEGSDPTAEPTQAPIPTAVPTEAPTPQPTAAPKPDPVTGLTWLSLNEPEYCDLDFDGNNEKIELKLSESGNGESLFSIMVTLDGGAVLLDSIVADRFICGFINNFNTGDNRVEIGVSIGRGNKERTTKIYKLNTASNGFNICSVDGWVDSVSSDTILLRRYVDLMGTWECANSFVLGRNDFALEKVNNLWTVIPEAGRLCTVSTDILVGIYSSGSENITAFLSAGEKLYPVATDLETIIDICLETGENGYMTITLSSDGDILYSGKNMDSWFFDLSYIN